MKKQLSKYQTTYAIAKDLYLVNVIDYKNLLRFLLVFLKFPSYQCTIRKLKKNEGGGYLIEYPDLPGCCSDGDTVSEALFNGVDAVQCWLEYDATKLDRTRSHASRTKKDFIFFKELVALGLHELAEGDFNIGKDILLTILTEVKESVAQFKIIDFNKIILAAINLAGFEKISIGYRPKIISY